MTASLIKMKKTELFTQRCQSLVAKLESRKCGRELDREIYDAIFPHGKSSRHWELDYPKLTTEIADIVRLIEEHWPGLEWHTGKSIIYDLDPSVGVLGGEARIVQRTASSRIEAGMLIGGYGNNPAAALTGALLQFLIKTSV